MRKGYYPTLVFSKKGNLIAISTGSDACAEHEMGSKKMMSVLCEQYDNEAALLKKLRSYQPPGVVEKIKTLVGGTQEAVSLKERVSRDASFKYPDVLEIKRITKAPKELQFIEVFDKDGKLTEAYMGLAPNALNEYSHELQYPSGTFRTDVNLDIAGAWDERSFAIRVRGAKLAKALKVFYQAMLDKKVVFAGTFMNGWRISGVILANTDFLPDEQKKNIQEAQADYEKALRLKALDDSDELYRELYKMNNNRGFGYLWAMFKDASETEVVYGLNPHSDVNADYLGPYTATQLRDWVASGCSYRLTWKSDNKQETPTQGAPA